MQRVRPLSQLLPQDIEKNLGDFVPLRHHEEDAGVRVQLKLLVKSTCQKSRMVIVIEGVGRNDELQSKRLATFQRLRVSGLFSDLVAI